MTPQEVQQLIERMKRGDLQFVTQGSDAYNQQTRQDWDKDTAYNPYDNLFQGQLNQADLDILRAAGFTGEAFLRDDSGGGEERNTMKLNPQVQEFLKAQGIQQGAAYGGDGFAYTGLLKDGKLMDGTARKVGLKDPAFEMAALAAMGITGANIMAAQGLLGGGAASTAGGATPGAAAPTAAAPTSAIPGAAAPFDPMGAYLTTGGAEGSIMGNAISGAGGASGAVGSGTFANTLGKLGPAGQLIHNAGEAVVNGGKGLLEGVTKTGGWSDLIKPAVMIAGAIDGYKGTPEETVTRQFKTDPRIDPYIYGDQGILKAASDWYQANKSGVNPTMQKGWDMQMGLLTDPNIQAQMTNMRNNAYGMLSAPVAGNGFSKFFGGGN